MFFNNYPALSGAVHYLESRNGTAPGIYGDGGLAAGPMQVHQAALTDVNRAYGWNYSHQQLADDPAVGKKVGDAYLALMRQKYGRDDYALGAYNAGPGAMDQAISSGQGLAALPASAQRYVREGLDRLGAAPPAGALATAPTNTSSSPMPSPFSSQYPNAADLLQVPAETPYVRDQSTPWLALGAGLLSSADPREAMSAGAAGLAKAQGQANKDEQAARQAAQDRAIRLAQAKATLGSADIARRIQMDQFGQTLAANQQNRADTLTLHRDQMAMQEQLRRDQLDANQQRWDADRAARADLIQQRAEAAAQAGRDKQDAADAAARDRRMLSVTKDELPMIERLTSSRDTVQRGQVILNQLDNGELELGPVSNTVGRARNLVGMSSPNSQNLAELERYVTTTVNSILNQAKGPQTDQDAIRARDNILANITDKEVVKQGLGKLMEIQRNLHNDTTSQIQGRRKALGLEPADLTSYQLTIPEAAPAATGDDGIKNIRRIK